MLYTLQVMETTGDSWHLVTTLLQCQLMGELVYYISPWKSFEGANVKHNIIISNLIALFMILCKSKLCFKAKLKLVIHLVVDCTYSLYTLSLCGLRNGTTGDWLVIKFT